MDMHGGGHWSTAYQTAAGFHESKSCQSSCRRSQPAVDQASMLRQSLFVLL
jgi:hypothetical protein